jgi:hypothetical protein
VVFGAIARGHGLPTTHGVDGGTVRLLD